MDMPEHKFGGPWTEVKLDTVMYYLECYTKALSFKTFELWYIDAFAGSGSREVETLKGGIFEGKPISVEREILAGSARRALAIQHFTSFCSSRQTRIAMPLFKASNKSTEEGTSKFPVERPM